MKKSDQTTSRRKKYIAPIIISALVVLYNVGIAYFFLKEAAGSIPTRVFILVMAFPSLIAIGVIAALISRIKEIQGGEEDDLSKY